MRRPAPGQRRDCRRGARKSPAGSPCRLNERRAVPAAAWGRHRGGLAEEPGQRGAVCECFPPLARLTGAGDGTTVRVVLSEALSLAAGNVLQYEDARQFQRGGGRTDRLGGASVSSPAAGGAPPWRRRGTSLQRAQGGLVDGRKWLGGGAMSTSPPRERTGAERRAARRKARNAPAWRRQPWMPWAAVAIVVVAIAAVAAILALRSSDGNQAGRPSNLGTASNEANGELSKLWTADFHAMAISPADGNVVLYGHHGGVLRSTDGGRNWVSTNLGGQADDAMGMGVSGAEPDVLYAAGHDTFFKSTDGGQTWKSLKPALPGTDIHGLAVAPDRAGQVYAYVVGSGLFRSDDGGNTWVRTSGSLPNDIMSASASAGGVVYVAGMQSGIQRSTDAGATFKPVGAVGGMVAAVAAAASDANIVYAGTDAGLFASRDAGATWTARTVPGGGEVVVVAVNPADARDVTVVAVQQDRAGHVFRSRDGGATWVVN